MELSIKYNLMNNDYRRLLQEIRYGYDIIIKKGTRLLYPLPLQNNKVSDKLVLDEILDYVVDKSELTLYIKLNDNIDIGYISEYLWIKYILNIIEMGVQVLDINIMKSKYPSISEDFSKVFDLVYGGARGIILKNYKILSNKFIIKTVMKLFNNNCIIFKEDETFSTDQAKLLERLNALDEIGELIYVYNTLNLNPNVHRYHSRNVIGSPLVTYLASGYRRIYEWFAEGHVVWGHRLGHMLIEKYVKKPVYLKLALLAGAMFLHVGTPSTQQEYHQTKALIIDLNTVRPFIPVFTGVPDREAERELIKISGGRAVLLSPIYWEGCN